MSQKNLPQASQTCFIHQKFDDKREDMYYWLREKDTPPVLKYLEEENKYAQRTLKPLEDLRNELFEEIKSRIPDNDDSVPASYGEYEYYSSWVQGKEYVLHKRTYKKTKKTAIILDENELAQKFKYCDVSGVEISPDQQWLGYALDSKGRELYDIYFKNLKTGEESQHSIQQVTSDFVWANDSQTCFYVEQDRETLRAYQVYRFDILTGEKQLVYEEKDVKFSVLLNKSLSEKVITIVSASSQTSECHYLFADNPKASFSLFEKRKHDHEYHINYGENNFYILTNEQGAFNFKLMKAPCSQEQKKATYPSSQWQELVPHRPDVFIEDYEVFKDYILLEVRKQGTLRLEILDKKTNQISDIDFDEDIYTAQIGNNCEYHSSLLRLNYASFTSPPIVYDYDCKTRKLHFKKQYSVQGDFDSSRYTSKREFAKARDGTLIPLSLCYRKDLKISPETPLFLLGYGSYGISQDPCFSFPILSLLDRGFIFAVAHVRGGSEMGKKWYEQGKFLKKKNTFYDFIDCAQFVVDQSYTSPQHLYIMGGSAGGLLIGAVLNERPDLFQGAVASVPFVDVLTTLLDESLPLTTGEYEEWGNPNQKEYYNYIKSYSPYDNIRTQSYPHLLVDTGYHDPRVQYWEPAKWVAKLRAHKKDSNLLLFFINMGTGHFGDTGRFSRLKLIALHYSFFLGLETGFLK